AMELDLDSFLNSTLTSDDDDENHHNLNSIPRRTIDEILNASDSSTSSPPTSPPSVYSRISDPKHDQDDAVSVSTTKQPSSDFSSIPAQHHDENPSLQSRPGSSKPLPSLFRGVRSNAKPGAALAAAVAASRALPTPHAAAIKSRRAAFQKVLENSDVVSVSASDELSSNSEIRNAKEDEVLEGVIGNEGSSAKEVVESEAQNVVQVDGLKVSSNHEELLQTSADSVPNFDVIEPRIGSSSISVEEEDENNVNVDENASVLDRSSEILNSEEDKVGHLEEKVEEESTIEALETQQQVNVLKDTEVGGVGGSASSLSDITELVEERIGQLESRRISKRAEKKSRAASMKPLELAEELEKKHASTVLHWEEGAAAQPMRLEGVRRGSTTLGYFDLDADNAITRTISSQAFRRDHGSPQALAVHTNYIAIGMSNHFSSIPAQHHDENPSLQSRPGSSKPLPSLFRGVRSNAKPGAALAAAVAASRALPTPHAAAIKSTRAAFRKVLQNSDAVSVSASDELSSNCEIRNAKKDEVLEGVIGNEGSSAKEVVESEAQNVVQVDGLKVSSNHEELLQTSADSVPNFDIIEPRIGSSSISVEEEDENNVNVDDNASVLDRSSEILNSEEDKVDHLEEKVEEESTIEALETQQQVNVLKDTEVGGVGGSASSLSDINELVEERIGQLESRRVSKRAEKKSRAASMQPLELAEELEKKHASTGLHWEEGAAAQPMRLEGVRRGSTTLGYFDLDADNAITRTISSQAFRRDHGSPQALAVHTNYIAIGMSKGVILVVPSKYSGYNADHMDPKMSMLSLQGDRSHAPVTSMCFNQQGDLLLAGYGDGHITVWDVQRSSSAKVITGEHTTPVVHTLFLGQDSQVTRQFKAVTGDSKGLVLLHAFSVVPLLNRFSIKTQCLLDGQKTGIVLSASPVLFDEFSGGASLSFQGNNAVSSSSLGSMMGGVVGGDAGWKLFNEGSSLAEEGVVIFVTHQTALVVRLTPTLEVRLTPTLEVYSQLSKPDGVREGSMPYTAWKCMTQSRSLPSENVPVEASERVYLLAIAWDRKVQVAKLIKSELKVYGKWSLDSAAIGVAWLDDQTLVVLTSTGQLCLFAKDGTVILQTSFSLDGYGEDDLVAYHTHFINIYGNPEKAFHNCIAVRGASVYILGPMHLAVSRLLPWKERIQVLWKAGDWMGALNMSLTLYDGQAHGVIDLPRTLDAVQEAIMPYLVELLLSYVDEVFSYILVAFCNQSEKMEPLDNPNSRSSSVHSEIKEQYTCVGGVAVEFCVRIKRTDIVFDEIFSKFVAVQQRDTFLELLEPYILKDMLGSLPPEIMQALVEHYSSKGWLQRVEQCVLHMDISSLDFNQVVRLCREHGLYGALVYLFNKGLDDFRAPLEELLVVLRNSQKESAAALVYRMLVYLKYCFSGLAFPPGQGTLPPTRLPSLRTELLQFLLEHSDAPNSKAVSSLSSGGAYLNLYHLLQLDTEATLDVLRCAFVEDEIPKPKLSLHDSADKNMEPKIENDNGCQNILVQDTVNSLICILNRDISQTERSDSEDVSGLVEEWPSKKDIGHMFEFIAYYVACLCEKAQFYQVCGFIHTIRHEYLAALDSYMKDVDEPIHAFSFINKTLLQLSDNERAIFQSAVISRIPELVDLSREGTFLLFIGHFNKEGLHILSKLRSHPRSLFLYLKTVIEVHLSGTLNFSSLRQDDFVDPSNGIRLKDHSKGLEAYLEKISDFPKLMRNDPLLCQYEPGSVLKFLETFDSYRVERCLCLCQEYGIIDAATFLLERVNEIRNILNACIGLCQRNTPRLNPEESETLWFRLLDSCSALHKVAKFCEPLMDSYGDEMVSRGENHVPLLTKSSVSHGDEACIVSWRISKSHRGAHILRKLFSQFIKEIVEGMIGYVRLPTIMSKLLSDNGSQEFGDFKLTILGMLGIYVFERRILDTAKSLIEDDTFYTMSLLKKGASNAYAPRSPICCICNCLFSKNSSSFSIRVFNCGHATHLQCEVPENEASNRGASSGCPVCIPKKKSHKARNKSILAENGLVSKFSSRPQQSHGTSILHPHESDALENFYGLQQISRFEILTNLQKDQRLVQIEHMPLLRLAPPAVYHERVKKGTDIFTGDSSNGLAKIEKQSKSKQLRELRVKGSSLRFP
ncbi:vacuolar protein sorting-associated protein 8 like protein, partial [Quercus suber]